MTITGVTGLTGSSTGTGQRVSDLGSTDFLNLLIEQLRNQNPLEPVGGTDFLAQTAQFSAVDSLERLNSTLTEMLVGQQLSDAANLIGKRVTYEKAGAAEPLSAVVGAVNLVAGQIQLAAGSDSVALAQVRSVQAA